MSGPRPPGPSALEVASAVLDPELPVLTLADLGVLREVVERDGRVLVTITPTYSGCPAVDEMGADLRRGLVAAGFAEVEVRTSLHPAWTTDWITEDGLRKLREAGIAPPSRIGPRPVGPVPLNLAPPPGRVPCPRCGSARTEELSRFGATACKALRRCLACAEPFEHVKEI
ncbi:1,2-phenylacetyl-CoA epoxidase subunit PaaD [Actinosynnema mirum]|uniref:Phenylacetate-CoA oxygenase, PaaJ subunit n=1 Tax=Actinosynnema mirum (strain ATCC 29888 / DSM 43827 / JCM 3225 / NBRC 14064 / NCIMB 13271 / NRRL B-12336 / IMRU 3971 / 101) TaxID=446462 RepID=C6WNC2_ACTMD|nr:1,2-phenylacetyl-CoA epoxidase subunit PaaD [Actinosynnema mirum]ACU40486.1 phenylacetate-CoA oxygenase, PaaJ subunit [Actinosynnema mirum DSM 43827]